MSMPDAFATGHVHAGILTVLTATDAGMVAASTRGGLTLHTRSLPGEERTALLIRAARDFGECERIAVTLAQPWPRLGGETPDPAQHWIAAGFRDAEVIVWMEAGVPWCSPAAELRDADVDPCKLAREWSDGVSLGLGFACGDVELEQVLREVA